MSGAMYSGATGSKMECADGCAIQEHRHGATPSGGWGGSDGGNVGSIKAQLRKNADDQDDGQVHLNKVSDWYDQLVADIRRLMEGTDLSEMDQVLAMLQSQSDQVQAVRGHLAASAEAVRGLAGRL